MVVSMINVSESHSHREAALRAELGLTFPVPALFLSRSKQKLVSYQLERTDRVDPTLEAPEAAPPPSGLQPCGQNVTSIIQTSKSSPRKIYSRSSN